MSDFEDYKSAFYDGQLGLLSGGKWNNLIDIQHVGQGNYGVIFTAKLKIDKKELDIIIKLMIPLHYDQSKDEQEVVKEFDAVVMPKVGRIIYLGTPQVEESLYSGLQHRGYKCRIWPARKPEKKLLDFYGVRLSPFIKKLQIATGEATDPL